MSDDNDQVQLNHPLPGEHLYLDKEKTLPVTVLITGPGETITLYLPGHLEVKGTHRGNLYNKDGERPWYT